MGISPWSQGDGKPPWVFSLEPDSGPFDITGLTTSNFTLVMINVSNKVPTNGTGTFSNLTPASGNNPATISYQLSTADSANVGMNDMRVVAKEGTSQQETFKFGIWECLP